LFAAAVFAGCLPPPVFNSIDNAWTASISPDVRRDLVQASASYEDLLRGLGANAHVLWSGVNAPSYGVEHDASGAPTRQSVQAVYIFELVGTGKCYMMGDKNDVVLAREHLGGGRYGAPILDSPRPVSMTGGEGYNVTRFDCAAVTNIRGGAHAPFAATASVR
jgi:hypothetical protein